MSRATSDWIDISVPLRNTMVHWPDDPPVQIKRILDMERGDTANVSTLAMSAHTGTHLDAPRHFLCTGKSIDQMPLEAMMGRARVIEILDPAAIKADELRRHHIRHGERLLFKTRNSERCWRSDHFIEDFAFITDEAAQLLAERRVRLVGIDYLSVDSFKHGAETHRVLLEAGIWVIEGLDLSRVNSGRYELICLPLKIEGGDGAPARAIVRKISA